MVATAAAAVIAVVLVVFSGTGGPASTRVVMPAVGNERAHAVATLTRETGGTGVEMRVSGLHPGDYYWLWVTGEDGHRVPAGTFQGSRGTADLRLTAAVPLSEARRIWVTDEHEQVVLDARFRAST